METERKIELIEALKLAESFVLHVYDELGQGEIELKAIRKAIIAASEIEEGQL